MFWSFALILSVMLVIGALAGWLAWIVWGRSRTLEIDGRPNWVALLVLGMVGSLIGGLGISYLLSGEASLMPTGFIGSFAGSLIVVGLYVWIRGRRE